MLTVVDEDDKRDQAVGQVILNLATDNVWRHGGTFTMQLQEVKVRGHLESIGILGGAVMVMCM
jgi:hypothetical protein